MYDQQEQEKETWNVHEGKKKGKTRTRKGNSHHPVDSARAESYFKAVRN
jgi:hypothetical protein